LVAVAVLMFGTACTEMGRSLLLVEVSAGAGFTMPPRGRAIVATSSGDFLARAEDVWTGSPLKLGVYVPKDVSGSVKVIACALNGAREVIDGQVTAQMVDVSPGKQSGPVMLTMTSGAPSSLCGGGDAGMGGHGGGSTGGSAGGGSGTGGAAGTGGATGTGGMAGTGGATGTGGVAGTGGTTGTGGAAGTGGVGGSVVGGRGGGGAAGTTGGSGGTAGSTAGTGGAAGRGGSGGTGGGAGRGGTGGTTGAGGTGGQPNQCADGMMNGNETDVDCGGSCGKCNVNRACAADTDCKTGSCQRLFCALVSGPPNWLSGPMLTYGRGYVTAGVALGPGVSTLFVIGARDDAVDTDPALTSYEELYTGETGWSAYTDGRGTTGAAATDAAGDLLIFSDSATWRLSVPHVLTQLSTVVPSHRYQAAAATGPNGLVYVVGGNDGTTGTASGAIEAYDPVMNKWTTGLRAMPTPRAMLAAATGPDGLIYAIGGTSDVEAYNPTTNTWTAKSALPTDGLLISAATGPDGRIYALGGLGGALGRVDAFTPAINRWASVAPISDSRAGIGVVVAPDGHIWAIGGTTNPEIPAENVVQIYGPVASITPTAGAPGSNVSITGSNFAANATVSVYLGSVTGTPLATGTTSSTGVLTAAIGFKVPSAAAGNQMFIVVDDRSQYPIGVPFRVQ
jgi:hypothetical protein